MNKNVTKIANNLDSMADEIRDSGLNRVAARVERMVTEIKKVAQMSRKAWGDDIYIYELAYVTGDEDDPRWIKSQDEKLIDEMWNAANWVDADGDDQNGGTEYLYFDDEDDMYRVEEILKREGFETSANGLEHQNKHSHYTAPDSED